MATRLRAPRDSADGRDRPRQDVPPHDAGSSWWQASDGKWYPPTSRTTNGEPPPPPPDPSRTETAAPSPQPTRSGLARLRERAAPKKKAFFSTAVVVGAVVWFGVTTWLDNREVEQAKDELRDLGASEQSIDDLVDLAEGADQDQVDGNDGVVSDTELELIRIMAADPDLMGVVLDHTAWSDAELRELTRESCEFAAESETLFDFGAKVAAVDGLGEEADSIAAFRGMSMGAACMDEAERLFGAGS